jgi:hypothetical protein
MMIFKYGFILALIFATVNGWAIGTRGGGKGVVCRDSHNNIQSVELLDIFEARARGVQFPNYQGDKKSLLSSVLLRARPFLQDFGLEMDQYTYDHFFSNYAFDLLACSDPKQTCPVSTYASYQRVYDRDIPLTDDSLEGDLNLPPNCRIEQIISGVTNKSFEINMNLVKYLDNLNSIGLFLHEAIYGLLSSDLRETDSQRIRRIAAHTLAGNSFNHRIYYLKSLQVPYISCGNYDNGYWDRLDFVQDPHSPTPKIIALADYIGGVHLVNFHHGDLTSSDVNTNISIQEFADIISQKKNFNIRISTKPDDIEFLTTLNFSMKSGMGAVAVTSRTGGSLNGSGLEERITCRLVSSGSQFPN